jgi:protein subunit release factor A
MPDIRTCLAGLHARYQRLTEQLGDAAIIGTPAYQAVVKDQARLGRLMRPYEQLRQAEADAASAERLLKDPDLVEMAREEVDGNLRRAAALLEEIKGLLVSADATAAATPSSSCAPAPVAMRRRCSSAISPACTASGASATACASR